MHSNRTTGHASAATAQPNLAEALDTLETAGDLLEVMHLAIQALDPQHRVLGALTGEIIDKISQVQNALEGVPHG